MRVVSRKKLQAFFNKHGDSKAPLLVWYQFIAGSDYETPAALRATFGQVDYVKPFHVFNVGRGYRLIALIQFDRQTVYVRHVLTHREYDRGKWKDK